MYACSYICELDDRIEDSQRYKLDVKSAIGWYYASRGIFEVSPHMAVRGAVEKPGIVAIFFYNQA